MVTRPISIAYKSLHMKSIAILEEVGFQNPPLREQLLLIFHFKVLYISPPTSIKYESLLLAEMVQQAGKSYEKELEIYNRA